MLVLLWFYGLSVGFDRQSIHAVYCSIISKTARIKIFKEKTKKLLKWQILKNCHNRKSQNGRISKTAIINIFKENRTKSILMTVFQKLPHSKWQNFKNRHNRNSQYGRISKTATKLITWEKLTNILKWQNFRNIF